MSTGIGFLIDLYGGYTKIRFRENAIFHFETTPHCVPPYGPCLHNRNKSDQ